MPSMHAQPMCIPEVLDAARIAPSDIIFRHPVSPFANSLFDSGHTDICGLEEEEDDRGVVAQLPGTIKVSSDATPSQRGFDDDILAPLEQLSETREELTTGIHITGGLARRAQLLGNQIR